MSRAGWWRPYVWAAAGVLGGMALFLWIVTMAVGQWLQGR